MGTVIYSTSFLLVFMRPIVSILFMGVLGITALAAAVFQKKQSKGARIVMAVCSLVLLTFGCATTAFSLASFSSGAETVNVRLNNKIIGTSGCDDGNTCTVYILETNTGQVNYDFVVNPKVYDLAQVNTCYQVAFYNYKSLLDATADTDTYHRIETITRIEVADPAACL